jgi:hypothetical protein
MVIPKIKLLLMMFISKLASRVNPDDVLITDAAQIRGRRVELLFRTETGGT